MFLIIMSQGRTPFERRKLDPLMTRFGWARGGSGVEILSFSLVLTFFSVFRELFDPTLSKESFKSFNGLDGLFTDVLIVLTFGFSDGLFRLPRALLIG
ncbi:hypothetical protein V6N12_011604 [Hibiscus sabdariffa]|uniref:Uncharacterized protein n=1 Tax=Hibiscus sabdariffa TaxID=183260 RepID=A0ABR2AZ50_9ROSI